MKATMFIHLAMALCLVEVVIQKYSRTGNVKYLNHELKFVKGDLNNKSIYWSLDSNRKNVYRIRFGRHYLDVSRKGATLIKKDGGEALEKFSEEQRLTEIKNYLDKQNTENEQKTKPTDEQGSEEREGNTTMDSDVKTGTSTSKHENSGASGTASKIVRDPIIEKSSRLTDGFIDSLTPEFLSHLTENETYEISTAFDKNQTSTLKENNEDDDKKEIETNKKPKIEVIKSSKNVKESNLVDKKESTKTETAQNTSGNQSTGGRTRRNGFVFELFPVFMHTLDKKILILVGEKCLTQSLKFEKCNFDDYWNLSDEFYWNIFKVENVNFLDGLKKMIDDKAKNNDDVKRNQFAKTENCPNPCPEGDCQSGDEDGDESKSIMHPADQPINPQFNPKAGSLMPAMAHPPMANPMMASGNIGMRQLPAQPINTQNVAPASNQITLTKELMDKLLEAARER
ncbi:uncharacterized protein VICG_01118 [Vittaforma corneae ATCC 50505]|uniref:Uncharacterized protein n=1 Tax=Vittaforma corneae (strain ATCC 50505) TaxID=993615 RepID=L2GLP5_VITCO|nr:uncharacterized protein VICG_01118 [Vittaforma corneae ATCC 50505]ELA41766.1 hypothetical protein VICG_01118 [Vittaforma corneae ATCC 50505]